MEHYKSLALNTLHKLIKEDNLIIEDKIYITPFDIYVSVKIGTISENYSNSATATVLFTVSGKPFDIDFSESATGVGENKSSAIKEAVINFIKCAYDGVLAIHEDRLLNTIKTNFFGVDKSWNVYISDRIVINDKSLGLKNQLNSWLFLKDEVKKRLGNRKTYFVKIYASKLPDGTILSEILINNLVDRKLSSLLYSEIQEWDNNDKYVSIKEFYFFIQQGDTYIKYPFKEDKIKEYVIKTIELFSNSNINDNKQDIFSNIFMELQKLTSDMSLTTELARFVPEICTEFYFADYNYTDNFKIIKPNNIEFVMYKNQSTSYEIIYRKIIDILSENIFDTEDFIRLMSFSAAMDTIRQLEDNNITHANVTISYYVNTNYFVR